MSDWVLYRLNYSEPPFALQSHLSVVSVGRADGNKKQLKGVIYIWHS